MEKINRIADNLGVDETWSAAREYLMKHGMFPAHPSELFQAEGQEADLAGSPELSEEPAVPEAPPAEAPPDSGFFYFNRP